MRTIVCQFVLLSVLSGGPTHLTAQSFDITNYGVLKNQDLNNAPSIQRAIDACAQAGGGTVYVPAGVFVTGTIHLSSNIRLFLDAGAVLKGSPRLEDYETYSLAGFGVNHYGLVFTKDAENVSIEGPGTIDGNNLAYFDWTHAKKIDSAGTRYTRQGNNYRHVDTGIGDGPVVPKDRPHQMMVFAHCRNVHLSDIQLMNSPFWTLHFADCDEVHVTGIRLSSGLLVPNGEGIDITSCTNVIVTGCDIRSGDDGFAITGFDHHYEIPGFNGSRHESGNIIVSNCNIQSSSCAFRIGYLDQNSVRNVHVSHVNITNSTRGIGIFLRDQGSLENISFEDMTIETRMHTGDWWGNGEPIHISAVRGKEEVKLGTIRNVEFRNIDCIGENGILLYGSDESVLHDIRLEHVRLTMVNSVLNPVAGGNIDLRGCLDPKEQLFASDIPGIYARYIDSLSIDDVRLNWEGGGWPSYFTDGLKVDHYAHLAIDDFDGAPGPGDPGGKKIALGARLHE